MCSHTTWFTLCTQTRCVLLTHITDLNIHLTRTRLTLAWPVRPVLVRSWNIYNALIVSAKCHLWSPVTPPRCRKNWKVLWSNHPLTIILWFSLKKKNTTHNNEWIPNRQQGIMRFTVNVVIYGSMTPKRCRKQGLLCPHELKRAACTNV